MTFSAIETPGVVDELCECHGGTVRPIRRDAVEHGPDVRGVGNFRCALDSIFRLKLTLVFCRMCRQVSGWERNHTSGQVSGLNVASDAGRIPRVVQRPPMRHASCVASLCRSMDAAFVVARATELNAQCSCRDAGQGKGVHWKLTQPFALTQKRRGTHGRGTALRPETRRLRIRLERNTKRDAVVRCTWTSIPLQQNAK